MTEKKPTCDACGKRKAVWMFKDLEGDGITEYYYCRKCVDAGEYQEILA